MVHVFILQFLFILFFNFKSLLDNHYLMKNFQLFIFQIIFYFLFIIKKQLDHFIHLFIINFIKKINLIIRLVIIHCLILEIFLCLIKFIIKLNIINFHLYL